MSKKQVIIILLAITIVHVILSIISPGRPMSKIGEVERWNLKQMFVSETQEQTIEHSEEEQYEFWTLNKITFFVTWIIIIGLILISRKVTKNLKMIPGRLQALFEILVEAFDDLCEATLGKKHARKYMPLILTLFVYIWISNCIGIIPSIWHAVDKEIIYSETTHQQIELDQHKKIKEQWQSYKQENNNDIIFANYIKNIYNKKNNTDYNVEYKSFAPEWIVLEEPTQDLNVTLGLGLLVFLVVIYSAVKKHGIKGVLKDLSSPFVIMLPMNIIGEIGKVVSHSFRLFGNIKGGVIIMIVISYLISNILLPIGLYGFFGLFVGTIQAFVFAMLALVYIAVWITEDEKPEEQEINNEVKPEEQT